MCIFAIVLSLPIYQDRATLDLRSSHFPFQKEVDKREVGVRGLSLLIPTLPSECDAFLSACSLSPLLSFLREKETTLDRERQVEVLTVLCLFLEKNGDLFTSEQLEFLQSLSRSLFSSSKRQEERKRALACLASLAYCMSDEAFHSLVSGLMAEAKERATEEMSFLLQVWREGVGG